MYKCTDRIPTLQHDNTAWFVLELCKNENGIIIKILRGLNRREWSECDSVTGGAHPQDTDSEVHNALLSGDPHDQLGIAYHLIIDNKRIADEAAKAELKDFYIASSPPPTGGIDPSTLNSAAKPHPERIISQRERAQSIDQGSRGSPMKRAKWHLGIRSQSRPTDIMNEVYRAMKALNFQWKIINPYHVQSLTNDQLENGNLPVPTLEIENQSPRQDVAVQPQKKCTGHHTMEFFEMCASLITQLAH
ncbi:hypothetical protein AGLY_011011 [Aphis glycines]|uniref:non-specific serine/threonine protein kinase n=1 Tax=Aphis glycines TaxID=307491 RepID=A0A6G0TCE7_APHGL|nr:hypothetical protein AGLY_011011 [Aphis glycines]